MKKEMDEYQRFEGSFSVFAFQPTHSPVYQLCGECSGVNDQLLTTTATLLITLPDPSIFLTPSLTLSCTLRHTNKSLSPDLSVFLSRPTHPYSLSDLQIHSHMLFLCLSEKGS